MPEKKATSFFKKSEKPEPEEKVIPYAELSKNLFVGQPHGDFKVVSIEERGRDILVARLERFKN